MSHQVSSYFYEQSQLKFSDKLVRQFLIGNSDYSDFVLRWPTFKSEWNGVRSTKATLPCANENRTFNFIRGDTANINAECELRFGYREPNWISGENSGYLEVSSGAALRNLGSSSYTMEVVFQIDSVQAGNYTGVFYRALQGLTVFRDATSGYHATFWFTNSSRSSAIGLPSSYYNPGSIHRLIASIDAGSLYASIYKDGEFVGGSSMPGGTGIPISVGSNFRIMRGYTFNLNGAIKIFAIRAYNRALTPSEIAHTQSYGLAVHTPVVSYLFNHSDYNNGICYNKINSYSNAVVTVTSPTQVDFTVKLPDLPVHDTITLLQGKLESIRYSKGEASLTMADKFKQLQERVVGTSDVPILFTGSSYLVSDLAWWLCTSYGGMDATANSSNPDIDWESFAEWAAIFSGDSIFANAKFTGTKVIEGLRNIAEMTLSAVYQSDNKIHFRRFTNVTSDSYVLDQNNYISHESEINDSDVVNRMLVMFNYNITSRYHAGTVTAANTASVNSFGLKESTEKNQSIWYINSASALNMAQRVLFTKGVPYEKLQVVTPMNAAPYRIGDTMYTSEPLLESFGDVYLALSKEINMNNGTITFGMDASQILGGLFTLDVSSLGGTAILS